MPSQIIFPCPNCGATQSVDDTTVSTQCQFCSSTISVPENLRPKASAPDPAQAGPQPYSFGGATGMAPMEAMPGLAGMIGLPSIFLNMDINKLRAMAMAARSGDKTEAARLYSETFGVGPDEAMQAAELMADHHHVVLRHMQFSTPPIVLGGSAPSVQIGGAPQQLPMPMSGMSYPLPSPPVVTGQGGRARWGACLAIVLVAAFGLILLGAIAFAALRLR